MCVGACLATTATAFPRQQTCCCNGHVVCVFFAWALATVDTALLLCCEAVAAHRAVELACFGQFLDCLEILKVVFLA
jgi:hypothetical protein